MNESNILPGSTLENTGLSRKEKQNIFSASLVEFVGKILIEKMFFQNLHVPQELLLSIVNNLIQTLNPSQKTGVNINLYQEGRILYKQWSGQTLTPEETHYDNAIKQIDVPGEILNGLKYSALALMGSNLYTSVSSAINQGLWNHMPAIVGYSGALLLGPQAIQHAVKKVLSCSGLTQKQKRELTPWLNTLGRLSLGFIPKVCANEQGVHYQYSSLSGHTETVTPDETPFRLHSIHEITEQKIKLHVINEAGKKIPVEFRVNQRAFAKEITVKSPDKQLETQWGECFKPILSEEAITCSSSLIAGTIASAAGQNPLPAILAAMNCIPKISAAEDVQKRYLEQTPNPPLMVNLPLDNQVTDIVIENGYAYTVNGADGLKILDVSNPNNILNVSQYDTPGDAQRIVLDKGYAYIADGSGGLQIINVKNVMSPIFAGVWMTGNPVIDVAIINNTAYLADGTNQLTAIDISVPENVLNTLLRTTNAQGVAVSGNMVYVADGTSGLRVIDVSNPVNPQLKGTVNTTRAQGVEVSGNIAYVADYTSLRVIDVSNPVNPQLKGTVNTMYAQGVAVSGNIAYMMSSMSPMPNSDSEFLVIDVSNVTNPQLKGILRTISAQRVGGVAVSGNIVYVGLYVIDVRNATNPQLKGTLATTYARSVGGVAISGNIVYVATSYPGLCVIDVSNATNPQLKGTLATTNAQSVGGVAISGNMVYVATSYSGLRVVDVSNPANPQLKGTLSTLNARDVAVFGNMAYVADYNLGLRITKVSPLIAQDIYFFGDSIRQISKIGNELFVLQSSGFQAFNPTIPLTLTDFPTTDAFDVAVSGNMAYVADYNSGLRVIDVSNPVNPKLRGTLETSNTFGVEVSGTIAYVAWYSGLRVIDVSNATNPQLKGTLATTNAQSVGGVAVFGNIAYFADAYSGLRVIDMSNITNPQLKGTLATTYAQDVAVSGNMVYVADGNSGFRVIDVSNPVNPQLKGTVNTTYALGVAVFGNMAYVADRNSGLRVIDVSNPVNPQLKATVNTTGAQGVAVFGNMAYVADSTSGLRVIDVSNPVNPQLKVTLATIGSARDVAVSGNTVFLATSAGLTIIDITNLPMKWLPFTSFSSPRVLLTKEPYAFITNNNGLSIFNISNTSQIQYLGRWNTSLTFNHMEVIENELWMGYSNGILVLNISDPTQPVLTGEYKCSAPVNSFFASNNTLYFPGSYQCPLQSTPTLTPTPMPTPTLMPTPTPIPTPTLTPTLTTTSTLTTISTINQTILNTTIFQNTGTGEVAGAVVGGIMGLATLAGLGFGIFKCRKNITPVQTLQGKDQDKVVDINGIIKQHKPF